MDTKIIDQLRNILNKTVENGATEAEAANAAAIAQKLLLKHRLTMADLAESASDSQAEVKFDFGEHFRDEGVEAGNRIAQWKITLFGGVCRANGCEPIFYSHSTSRGGRGSRGEKFHKMVVIGEEKDAVLVKAFYINLRDTIESMAKRNQPRGLGKGEGKRWANSFKLGACHAIYWRLQDAMKEAVQENRESGTTSTALVRLDNQEEALATYMKAKHPNLKKRLSSSTSVYSEAYSQGRQKGERVNLSTNLL